MTDLPAKQTVRLRATISGYGGTQVPIEEIQYAENFVIEYGGEDFDAPDLDTAVAIAAAFVGNKGAVLAKDTHDGFSTMVNKLMSEAPVVDGAPAPVPMAV